MPAPAARRSSRTLVAPGLLALACASFLAAYPAESQRDSPLVPTGATAPSGAVFVDSLDLSKAAQDWDKPQVGKSIDKNPLRLGGVTYAHGIGAHANFELHIDLKGAATRFASMVGIDDERPRQGSVSFEVLVDGKTKAQSGPMRGGDKPKLLEADLTGGKRLTLIVGDVDADISHDHADWAGAVIYLKPGATERLATIGAPSEPAPDIHHETPDQPVIHGPRVVGATPGRPFLFLIPATGKAPLRFAAKGLSAGLSLDQKTGIIAGELRTPGEWNVGVEVSGPAGRDKRSLKILGGDHKLAQTPPLGWNSWNVWAGAVDAVKVKAAADGMIASGLAAHGFSYVNIDDTWEAGRNASGEIETNSKFPEMKNLCDYVHAKGLKIGIYSSPGPKTCAGFEASYNHEDQDAATYAKWGFDYLKYDWCSYGDISKGETREELMKPYRRMRQSLDKADRDIVFSLCQYGMGNVWEWGSEVGGNCWRTTGDITDTWSSLSNIAFSQDGHEKYAGPGHWNDPDMLIVGKLGWGPNIHPTRLTPNEQITHITMWCLQSSPLLLGNDLTQLDPFTVDLVTNDEVLDVNQDPLGKPAGRKAASGKTEVWARPLYDGTIAVGLFNRGWERATVTAKWTDLGLTGKQPVRDLWLWKDLGPAEGSFTTSVPGHGAVLIKIGRPKQ